MQFNNLITVHVHCTLKSNPLKISTQHMHVHVNLHVHLHVSNQKCLYWPLSPMLHVLYIKETDTRVIIAGSFEFGVSIAIRQNKNPPF